MTKGAAVTDMPEQLCLEKHDSRLSQDALPEPERSALTRMTTVDVNVTGGPPIIVGLQTLVHESTEFELTPLLATKALNSNVT